MRFWDTSAIVPLLVDEPATATRLRQLEADPVMVVWWGTAVECASALQRLVREDQLTSAEADQALERLTELETHWSEVEPTALVRRQAGRLLRLHPLRAADALQLAAAVVAANHDPVGIEFLSADDRLRTAAAKEGFKFGA